MNYTSRVVLSHPLSKPSLKPSLYVLCLLAKTSSTRVGMWEIRLQHEGGRWEIGNQRATIRGRVTDEHPAACKECNPPQPSRLSPQRFHPQPARFFCPMLVTQNKKMEKIIWNRELA